MIKDLVSNPKYYKNPFILFFPFLVLYILIILIFSTTGYAGDETRYITFAENLTNGFYSPPPPAFDLGNAPGYPIILAPFIALDLPILFIKLLNGIFYYLSIIYLYKALIQIVSYKFSIIFSIIWAIYPTFFELITHILPDILAVLLITLFIFTTLKSFKSTGNKNLRYILYSGLIVGYLTLTKPIFGYVVLFMLAVILIMILFSKKRKPYQKSALIFIIALFINIPYLAYTYQLSGKLFYWSSFGGNNLYWMTSPFESEYGDWMGFPPDSNNIYRIKGSERIIKSNHQKDFDEILSNADVQKANINNGIIEYNLTKGFVQDDIFKKIAIRNIKSHPGKFISNCFSNVGRMVFNYPYSYSPQKPSTLLRLPVNGILLVVVLFCLLPTIINWKKIIFPIRFLLLFIIIYFGGSIFGSAEIRMFLLVVPVLLVWIAYILPRTYQVKLNWNDK